MPIYRQKRDTEQNYYSSFQQPTLPFTDTLKIPILPKQSNTNELTGEDEAIYSGPSGLAVRQAAAYCRSIGFFSG